MMEPCVHHHLHRSRSDSKSGSRNSCRGRKSRTSMRNSWRSCDAALVRLKCISHLTSWSSSCDICSGRRKCARKMCVNLLRHFARTCHHYQSGPPHSSNSSSSARNRHHLHRSRSHSRSGSSHRHRPASHRPRPARGSNRRRRPANHCPPAHGSNRHHLRRRPACRCRHPPAHGSSRRSHCQPPQSRRCQPPWSYRWST